jgi:lysine 6-dehydrogenase
VETVGKKQVAVLGAGLVGSAIAKDLAADENFKVTSFDKSFEGNNKFTDFPQISKVEIDALDKSELTSALAPFDYVVNAVPGAIGFEVLRTIIESGKNVVDIAFYPEDPFELNKLALENGVTAIVDCGVAPGMSNFLSGYAYGKLDKTDSIKIYVGGLPKLRQYPFEYKAVFSPSDVIEEYTRPARLVESGNVVTKPPLTEPEILDFPQIGSLEAFNSDGLRTLIETLDAPDMKEKTLRYVGHREKMMLLRDMGFFETAPIEMNGNKISPLDFTSNILFPQWKLEEGEIDITVMQIVVKGTKDSRQTTYVYNLYDEYSPETGIHSMARTTGYTATAFLRLLNENVFNKPGVFPPEILGKEGKYYDFIIDDLKRKNIIYSETILQQ